MDENRENNHIDASQEDDTNLRTRPLPFAKDPRYEDLLVHYQNGDWDASARIADELLKDFPDDPSLLEFRREINVKRSLQASSEVVEKEDRRERLKQNAGRIGIFALVLVVLLGIIIYAVSQFRTRLASNQLAAQATATYVSLSAKYENAQSFLQAERSADALELLREIQSVAPDFMGVSELIAEAERLYAVDQEYQQALQLFNQGSLEDALEIFKRIEEEQPGFRGSNQKITDIEKELEIRRLFGEIDASYLVQDWQGVIDAYDQILALDPTTSFDGLKEILFLGYLNLIQDIAGRDDVSIEDIDLATEYYYNALSLLPQNPEYASEREELQRVATSLIGNRYYLFAIDLLNTQGYSPAIMNEALRLLRLADNIGAGSPAITAEIDRAELFVTGYDAIASGRYGDAIDQLEGLYRLDAGYGDGMVQYLLYEAYMARGDLLYTYGDYVEARSDYELAETFGWGDYGNALRLFEVETRIGFTLRRLYLLNEAAEYYNYAFSLIDFEEKVYQTGDNELISDWEDAQTAFARNDEFNAARLFESVLEKIEIAYSFETVQVSRGDSIFEVSYNYGSTAQVIRDYNQLGVITVFKVDQEIVVPYIPEN